MADERVHEFTAGRAIQVPLSSVEKELASLWREVAKGAESAGAKKRGVTRACLWNLVVRVRSERGLVRAKAVIDAISPSVPARVLVLDTREGEAAHPVRAWIEANFHASEGGASQIGSEEVTLMAAGASIEDLPQVVRALTVPDVPTAALWLGAAPSAKSALDRELGFADRLILDADGAISSGASQGHGQGSGDGEGPIAGIARLAAFVARRPNVAGESGIQGSSEVTDLAWLRGASVRSLVASLFEPPCAANAEDALAVDEVAIACRPDRLGTAILVAGWLASRLGWTGLTATANGTSLRFRRKDGPAVQVHLRRAPEAPEPIGGVELHTAGGRYAITFNERAVIVESPSIAWKEPLLPPVEAELWTAALGAAGRDQLYRAAIDLLARAAT